MKIKVTENTAYVYTPYNGDFVKKIKCIGGARWNGAERCWQIPASAVDAAREIMRSVYGSDDLTESSTETINLRVKVLVDLFGEQGDVILFGKCLCHASSRDSGGRPGSDVSYIVGEPTSGGSAKYWGSVVPEGSEIILSNVSKAMYDGRAPRNDIDVQVIQDKSEKEKLLEEKEKIEKRLAEITALLETM